MKNKQILGRALIVLGLLGIQVSHAENQLGGKPSEEAISLCINKAIKSQCDFQGPQGLESGYCEYTPDQEYFACNPNKNNEPPKSSGVKKYPSHLAPNTQ